MWWDWLKQDGDSSTFIPSFADFMTIGDARTAYESCVADFGGATLEMSASSGTYSFCTTGAITGTLGSSTFTLGDGGYGHLPDGSYQYYSPGTTITNGGDGTVTILTGQPI